MPVFEIFLPSAILAEIIGTITGFGATTILLPIALFLMPIKEAIVLVSFFHFLGTTFRTLFFVKDANLKVALIFGIPSLVFSFIGASLLHQLDAGLLMKIIGALLILYSLFSLFRHKIIVPKNLYLLFLGGGVVGFLAGLIGTAGALRGALLTSWNLPKKKYLGTAALMGLGADIARVIAYKNTGIFQIKKETIIVLAVTALIGTLIGKKLVSKIDGHTFAKIIFIGLLLVGIKFLLG